MKRRVMKLAALFMATIMLMGCGANSGVNSSENTEDVQSGSEIEEDPYGAAGDPAVTLVYAEVNPKSSISGQIAAAFAEKCQEYSGGSVKLDVRYAGVMGSEDKVLADLVEGTGDVQMARIFTSYLNDQGTKRTPVITLPYVFESREHFWKFATSPLAQVVLDETGDTLPIRGLFYGEEGFRHFFTSEVISSYKDLAGKQLRVSADSVMQEMVRALGATPVFVPFTDLYPALQHKEVDGAEQPIINYQTNMFPEVALNLLLDGHTMGIFEIVIADETWESLTEAQQAAVTAAGEYAQKINKESIEAAEQQALEELRGNGVNVIEVSAEDREEIEKLVTPIIEQYTQYVNAQLYNEIRAMVP